MDIERMRAQVAGVTHSSQLRVVVAQLVEALAELDVRVSAITSMSPATIEPALADQTVKRGPGRPRKMTITPTAEPED